MFLVPSTIIKSYPLTNGISQPHPPPFFISTATAFDKPPLQSSNSLAVFNPGRTPLSWLQGIRRACTWLVSMGLVTAMVPRTGEKTDPRIGQNTAVRKWPGIPIAPNSMREHEKRALSVNRRNLQALKWWDFLEVLASHLRTNAF